MIQPNKLLDPQRCVVAIKDKNCKIIGSGLIVEEDLILTCHHVILAKDKLYYNSLLVSFSDSEDNLSVHVEKDYCYPDIDIAFLRLKKGIKFPTGKFTIPKEFDEDIQNGHPFNSFGFNMYDTLQGGLHASGEIRGKVKVKLNDKFQERIQLDSPDIIPGMSGAPIINSMNNKIIGIISDRWIDPHNNQNNNVVSFANPINKIILDIIKSEYKLNYLNYVKELRNNINKFDNKPILNYYIPHDAVIAEGDTWNLKDDKIYKIKHDEIKDVKNLLEDFLKDDDQWIILIGGINKVGKTTMAKMIASHYSSIYNTAKDLKWFPIICFLENCFNNAYREDNLDYVVDKIQSSKRDPVERIILILDGLNYCDEEKNKLFKNLRNLKESTSIKIKIVITTSTKEGKFNYIVQYNKYIRLLSFNIEKFKAFLIKYGMNENYIDRLLSKYYDKELIEPGVAWSLQYFYFNSPFNFMPSRQYSSNMLKAFLAFYRIFIDTQNPNIMIETRRKQYNINKRDKLRQKAILKIIDDKTLTFDERKKLYDFFGLQYKFSQRESGSNQRPNKMDKSEIPDEYLVAEYIIQSILEGNIHRLNLGKISQITIQYLDGLIDLLKTHDLNLEKFMLEDECSLLNSFIYNNIKIHVIDKRKNFLEQLKYFASKAIHNSNVFSISTSIKHDVGKRINIPIATNTKFKDLWLYRWISLFVLSKLEIDKKEWKELAQDGSKENFIEMIKYSGNLIPQYLKEFKLAELSNADLQGIDFSYSNLAGCDFNSSYLSRTNFSHADLSEVDLSYADLSYADLSYAKLNGAILYEVNLQGANLTGADLSDAQIDGGDLSSSNLMFGKLIHTNIRDGVLFNSNLSVADVSNTDFSGSILSGADLSGSTLHATDFSGTLLSGADFSNAIFNGVNMSGSIILDVNLFGTDLYDPITKGINKLMADTLNVSLDNAIINDKLFLDEKIDKWCKNILELHIGDPNDEIRFVGIFDPVSCEFKTSYHRKGVKLLLAQKEKTMMLQLLWKGSIHRTNLENKIGKMIYSVEKHEKLKRITIRLDYRNDPLLLFITCESNFVSHTILTEILDPLFKPNVLEFKNNTNMSFQTDIKNFNLEIDSIKYQLCKEITKIEGIRSATVCDTFGKVQARYIRQGLTPLISASESDESIYIHWTRWKLRKKFAPKIGRGEYAYAVYEKVKRITIPLKNDLLLASFEIDADNEKIVQEINKKIREF